MNKGLLGKISLFSLLFLAIIIKPAFSSVNSGDLKSLYGNSICGGGPNPCPVWINATRGDMFFANGNQVFIVVNYSCSPPSVCNSSMSVTGNFSAIGGSSNVVGVFKQNATNYAWAIFELNSTVNFSAISDSITMSNENIFLNATDGNTNTGFYNDALNATVMLVNMSAPLGCPPSGQNAQIPSQVRLLDGTLVNTTSQCFTNCTVDDVAQLNNTNSSGSYYNLCGPAFGGSSTNFTAVAESGNFSNFAFVLDVPGKVKINFTQNVSMDTQQRSQALFQFAMSNMMSGPRIGINESQWNGTDTSKPNLTLSARLTIYNFSGRFGIPNGLRPSISRRSTYGTGNFSPCPSNICSGVTWDGQNLTFDVTGFSEYSIGRGLSMVLSSTTGQNFNSTTNISYSNTRNVNFSYTPTWNSTVSPQTVTLWGNFTGTWASNVTNNTALTNATLNYINNTVDADGAYLWNAVINDTTGGNDTNSANWTIVVDTVSPTWFNLTNASTPTNYSSTASSQFNITWNDTLTPISTVFITIRNSTNASHIIVNNASMSNSYGGSIYNYSIVLPAGTFNWTSYANDSANNWNASYNWTFTIGKAPTLTRLFLNGTEGNNTYNYSQTANLTATVNVSGLAVNVGNNKTGGPLSAFVGSVTPVESDITMDVVGTTNITAFFLDSANYSASSQTYYANVTKGVPTLNIYIGGAVNNSTITYPSVSNISANTSDSGNSDCNYTLWRNDTSLVNGSSVWNYTQLSNGTYAFKYNTTGCTNWTSGSSTTYYLFVNKGTLSISINGSNVTYPNSVLINGTRGSNSVDTDVNYTLWRNNTLVTSGFNTSGNLSDTTQLGVGWYVYTYNATGGTNWTANSTGVSLNINVSQGTPSLVITGPSGWAVTSPTSATVLCTASSSEVTAFLYRGGTNTSSNNETVSSSITTSYNYTCNSSATANYTAGQATPQLLTLNAASSSTTGSISSVTTTSSSSSPYIMLGVGKTNITMTSLTTSGKMIATIAKYQDDAIRGMNITVVNNVANIKIMITKVSALPSTVPFDILGKVYNYINIDKTNMTDSDINIVNLLFAVNKTWLTNNNVASSNITLYRWANNKWNDLNATKVSEDSYEVFYTANSPGLSVFVIGTKGVQASPTAPTTPTACTENWQCIDWSSCVNNTQTRTCTDSNNCGTTTNKPAESQSCQSQAAVTLPTSFSVLSYVIVIVIAIIACVLIFLERTKITSYFQKISKKK